MFTKIQYLIDSADILPKQFDVYENFYNVLLEYFRIDTNILEVGCGEIPKLGNIIASHQFKINSGSITVYDNSLKITKTKYPNLKLNKKLFTESTDIKNIDLLIGQCPCNGTRVLINKALEEKKDLFVGICNCENEGKLNSMLLREAMIKDYCDLIRNFNRKIDVIHDDNLSFPIIASRRR